MAAITSLNRADSYSVQSSSEQNTTALTELDTRIVAFQKEKESLAKSQEIYKQRIARRNCLAQITSCLLCPLTCLAHMIPILGCYYCNCYCILNDQRTCYDTTCDYIGCVMFKRPLENERELCCIYCTPMCMDFPDIQQTEGFDLHTLPTEKADAKARTIVMGIYSIQIDKLQAQKRRYEMYQVPIILSHEVLLDPWRPSPSKEEMT